MAEQFYQFITVFNFNFTDVFHFIAEFFKTIMLPKREIVEVLKFLTAVISSLHIAPLNFNKVKKLELLSYDVERYKFKTFWQLIINLSLFYTVAEVITYLINYPNRNVLLIAFYGFILISKIGQVTFFYVLNCKAKQLVKILNLTIENPAFSILVPNYRISSKSSPYILGLLVCLSFLAILVCLFIVPIIMFALWFSFSYHLFSERFFPSILFSFIQALREFIFILPIGPAVTCIGVIVLNELTSTVKTLKYLILNIPGIFVMTI